MNANWVKFINRIQKEIKQYNSIGSQVICFRGHASRDWDLIPTLLVKMLQNNIAFDKIKVLENNLYSEFVTNSGNLFNANSSDWEILFLMRHHGIPTRILDWTESFGTALYFALNGDGDTPTIWMVDPHELNDITFTESGIPNPITDLKFSYSEAYLEKSINPFPNPISILPSRNSDRLFSQKGLFTLHGSNLEPLNQNLEISHCFKRFEIPKDCIKDAQDFLELAGINNYSIFPDLDGLARYITEKHFKI